jgi:hypothetical protein
MWICTTVAAANFTGILLCCYQCVLLGIQVILELSGKAIIYFLELYFAYTKHTLVRNVSVNTVYFCAQFLPLNPTGSKRCTKYFHQQVLCSP